AQVGEHEVRRLLGERLEGGGPMLRGAHAVAGRLEQLDEREADRRLVVDDEDVHGDGAPIGLAASARSLARPRDASACNAPRAARASGPREAGAAGSRILNSA